MALAIATNNAALNAAASASSVNRDMETSMARLSTGKRINSASDDAAGVAISSRLSAEIRGTDQAIRNSLDGQALIDTAEGAHKEIENILQRMREVSVQAANDTNNTQDRGNLAAEMSAMVSEIDRISDTTTWAGTDLMSAAKTSFSFQVGAATEEPNQIKISIDSMGTAALGIGASTETEVLARDKEITDYKVLTDAADLADDAVATADDEKGVADKAAAVGGDIAALAIALDAAEGDDIATALTAMSGMVGHVDTRSATAVSLDATNALVGVEVADGTDGKAASDLLDTLDAKIGSHADAAAGDAKAAALIAVNAAVKAITDEGDAAGVFATVTGTVTEAEAVEATLGVAKKLTDAVSSANQGVEDAAGKKVIADKAVKDYGDAPGEKLSETGLLVDSGGTARDSIKLIDLAIMKVNDQRSALGAVSNRLNHTVNNLTNISSNLSAAKGGIEDADFALETTNLAKNQILQQASTAMLAQANASKQNVLSLLQG